MATSTCVKCGNSSFEFTEIKVSGSGTRKFAIQCSMCGGVVGVQDYFATGPMLTKMAEAIKAIAAKAGVHVNFDA